LGQCTGTSLGQPSLPCFSWRLAPLAKSSTSHDYIHDQDWPTIDRTREYLRRKLPTLQGGLRALGAIPIDARQPLNRVVDAILSRTLR
jgi:hypothetical protein